MEIYLDGSVVTLDLPFVDNQGSPVAPSSASYRVLSEDNSELVASTAVTINSGDVKTSVTIGSPENTLAVGARKALRTVELVMVTAMGTITSSVRYVIESSSTLAVGETSFQTYNEALLTGLDMANIDHWQQATDRVKKTALIEAYHNLCRLRFKVGDVSVMDATAIAGLSAQLQGALAKAQIAEADYILGGDGVGDKRRIGLMSETVGESSNMFRPGKPLALPASEGALRYLSGHITWGAGLSRG